MKKFTFSMDKDNDIVSRLILDKFLSVFTILIIIISKQYLMIKKANERF